MNYDDEAFENMPDSLPRHGALYLHATHIGSFIDRVEVKKTGMFPTESDCLIRWMMSLAEANG